MAAGRGIGKMRYLGIVTLCVALGGCALERAQIAQQAQSSMIGMPKEQVLACMGPPVNKAIEGRTEVWAYSTNPTINLDRGSGSTRYCNINITMNAGAVSAVNYQGPTGGLISQGEQCAYAVDACVKPRRSAAGAGLRVEAGKYRPTPRTPLRSDRARLGIRVNA
jgi:hypothetical protein